MCKYGDFMCVHLFVLIHQCYIYAQTLLYFDGMGSDVIWDKGSEQGLWNQKAECSYVSLQAL